MTAHPAHLDPQERLEPMESQEIQDPLVPQERSALLDLHSPPLPLLLAASAHLDLVDHPVPPELPVDQETQDLVDPLEPQETQDARDLRDSQEAVDSQDRLETQDPRDQLETQEPEVAKDSQDPRDQVDSLDPRDHLDLPETVETQEGPEDLDPRDLVVLLAHLDPLDNPETQDPRQSQGRTPTTAHALAARPKKQPEVDSDFKFYSIWFKLLPLSM
jgi:hypothetical protein